MRDLNPGDVKNVAKEDIIRINIDRINKNTTITTAHGYVRQAVFIPMPGTEQKYAIDGLASERTDKEYWSNIDKHRRPSITIYGLLYTAKKAGVKIKYVAITEGEPKVSIQGLVVTFDIVSEVTVNQDLIALVEGSTAAQKLIYIPEIVDAEAIVYSPTPEHEIE